MQESISPLLLLYLLPRFDQEIKDRPDPKNVPTSNASLLLRHEKEDNHTMRYFTFFFPLLILCLLTTMGCDQVDELTGGGVDVDVIVSNSEGQVVVPVKINNPLKGSFEGVYDSSSYFAFDFLADGTMTIKANSETNPDEGTGTWTLDGNEVSAIYTYEGTTTPYAFRGILFQTSSKATLEGDWYFDDSFTDAQKGGDFTTELQ